jgi:hypothetical protein
VGGEGVGDCEGGWPSPETCSRVKREASGVSRNKI